MKNISKLLSTCLFFLLIVGTGFISSPNVYAIDLLEGIKQFESDPGLAKGSITDVISNVVLWLLGIAGVVAVLAIIWGAIMYIASFADESRAKEGKKIIINAVVGLLLAGAAFLIVMTVEVILGGSQ